MKIENIVKKAEKQEKKKVVQTQKNKSVKSDVKTQKITVANSKAKPKKHVMALVVSLLIIALILSGGIYYLIWNANREFEITFVEVGGVEYEGYDTLTVKNGTTFTFSLELDSNIIAYSRLAKVTANGTAITPSGGVYSVRICGNTTIIAQGYGTTGINIQSGIIQSTGNTLSGSSLVIPYGVTEIGLGAFAGSSIQSVFIPSTVSIINTASFYSCTSLETINISDSTFKLNNMSFDSTKWLNDQPNGPVYLGSVFYTYKGTAPANSTLNLVDGTKGVAGGAIMSAQSNIITLNLPDSVEYIGDFAFVGCANLSAVTIGDNVKQMGQQILNATLWYTQQSSGLIYLNNWLYGFKGTLSTGSLTIRDGIVGIAGHSLYNLSGLTSVDIPDSVRYIGAFAFYQTGITSMVFSDNIEYIGEYAFYGSAMAGELTIPESVESIGSYAFDTTDITGVIIDGGINVLSEFAFGHCYNLTSVTVNGKLNGIVSNAFFNCSALISLTLYCQTPPVIIGTNLLSGVNSGIQIYVPSEYVNTYKSDSAWSAYGDKIFAIENQTV